MKESLLHYVWQNKLFAAHDLLTTEGETLEVIDPGRYNTDAGPDFFNAKIKIGATLWAGNVEIHTRSSDWLKHNHHVDKAYDSVILHVVAHPDADVFRSDGQPIPQMKLDYPQHIETNYDSLLNEQKWIRCADKLPEVPTVFIHSWKNALLTERLEQKMMMIEKLLVESNQHWEEAFYITLARSFGFGTNSQAFENLARSLPVSVLGKHKDHLLQLEALLFGQAGLLETDIPAGDEYPMQLRREYVFLKQKYGLQPLDASQWKLLRLRPDNFPHIRLAQFAALIHSSTKLFSKILENPAREFLHGLFLCEPSDFWATHYLFDSVSASKSKRLGRQSADGLIINTVVPFLFSYASHKADEELKEAALRLLEEIPAEHNAIVAQWQELGVEVETAFDSQALLQLKKVYCDEKKCLRCRIGHKVLTQGLSS